METDENVFGSVHVASRIILRFSELAGSIGVLNKHKEVCASYGALLLVWMRDHLPAF